MALNYRSRTSFKLYLSIVIVTIAIIVGNYLFQPPTMVTIVNKLEKGIAAKEKTLDVLMQNVKQDIAEKKNLFDEKNTNLYKNQEILLLVYDKDSLIYWSDNAIPFDNINPKELKEQKILKLENGWFIPKVTTVNNNTIVGLILIKHEFVYQNDYLINSFNIDFKVPDNLQINTTKSQHNVLNSNGAFLFSIQKSGSVKISDRVVFLLLLFYLAAFLLFISFLTDVFKIIRVLHNKSFLNIVLLIFFVFIIRGVFFYFKIPTILYASKLFSPFYYAVASYLPSLGDLIIDISLLLYVTYFIFKRLTPEAIIHSSKQYIKHLKSIGLTVLLLIICYGYVTLFKSIIIDSSISLELNNIFVLNEFSLILLLLITLLTFSFYFITHSILRVIFSLINKIKQHLFYLILAVIIVLFLIIFNIYKESLVFPIFFLLYFIISYIFIKNIYFNKISITYKIIIYILIFSLFSTFTLYKYNNIKEKDKRKLLALKLSSENDPVAEFLFSDISKRITSDSLLDTKIKNNLREDSIAIYLKNKYFKGYWTKYRILITICKPSQTLLIKPEMVDENCDVYFNNKINTFGIPTTTDNMYSLDYGAGNNSYIAVVKLLEEEKDTLLHHTAYIELDNKVVSNDLGYPELLIDKQVNIIPDLTNYSYARYNKKELGKHYGKYLYTYDLKDYGKMSNFNFFNYNGYNHLYYNVNNKIDFLLSKRSETLFDSFAPFSYFFIIYGLFVILFFAFSGTPLRLNFNAFNFKIQLQTFIVSIILISFITIGIMSLIYITSLNSNKNNELLTEKTHSILVNLEQKFGNTNDITPSMDDYVADVLIKLSNVFFTDVNLFDTNGDLIASSRSQIFDEGLISRKMNPIAFDYLNTGKETMFINKESIGKHYYSSAYIPLRNNENQLIAYLNLPYFAKQNELKKEISSFLKAYLNIYVFLIAISIFIVLIISNYITKPLKLIKDKLSKVKLGEKNEKIDWIRNDEIGGLIEEYNSMVDQLATSAKLLAQSEREFAWREMAKQVAHEIKNPLTPMKLSVQHLQKAWMDNAPDWDDRLKRFTNTIVEQIESLSIIASEFSDFAKMPVTENKKIDLSAVLVSAIGLFKESIDKNIQINYIETDKYYYINADKKQMLRVFNNLLKNSIQAIPNDKNGIIDISIESELENYLVKVTDNGIGIKKELYSKIFSPNFTTKTGGMGLGLAMVKSIIENAGGKVWFESEISAGTTTFFITLPIYNSIKEI